MDIGTNKIMDFGETRPHRHALAIRSTLTNTPSFLLIFFPIRIVSCWRKNSLVLDQRPSYIKIPRHINKVNRDQWPFKRLNRNQFHRAEEVGETKRGANSSLDVTETRMWLLEVRLHYMRWSRMVPSSEIFFSIGCNI
jgi:hypothetical protein